MSGEKNKKFGRKLNAESLGNNTPEVWEGPLYSTLWEGGGSCEGSELTP